MCTLPMSWLQRLILVVGLLCSAAIHAAESIEIRNASLVASGEADAWLLSADIEVQLSGRLEEAVNQGVPLFFVLELDVAKPRWYWWNDKLISTSQSIRLSFNALSRSYRVSSLQSQQSFATLAEALQDLGRLRGWRVAPLDRFRPDSATLGFVRLRLDVSQLPKPLQVSAITNKALTLQSEWTKLLPIEAPSSIGR